MRPTTKLPTRADGALGLIDLALQLGDETTYNLIRRCREPRGKAANTLSILAHCVVAAKLKDHDAADARRAAAVELGYPDWRTHPNFYKVLDAYRDDVGGDPELLELADRHGDAAVYEFIRLCRTANGTAPDAGREALTALARRLVDREMADANVDYLTAKQNVAAKLGYTRPAEGHTRSNFYQILGGGRAPEKRASSSTRGKEHT